MAKIDKRIDEIQMDEGEYFVYLKPGFKLDLGTPTDFQHCFGAQFKKDIREQMKDVKKCKCKSCLKMLQNND